MDHFEMAKQLLGTCAKTETQYSIGDVVDLEVSWYDGTNYNAVGYFFMDKLREVHVDGLVDFFGAAADELRNCFASEQVETVREEASSNGHSD